MMKTKLIFVGHVVLKSKLLKNPLNIQNVHNSLWKRNERNYEVKIMCSVADMPEFDIEKIEMDLKEYVCLDCENKFKGIGNSVICPACKSNNVEIVSVEK